jgi:hypothetical protein
MLLRGRDVQLLDYGRFLSYLVIHLTFPFNIPLVILYTRDRHSVRNHQLLSFVDIILGTAYIYLNCSHFVFGHLFATEVMILDFFMLYRAVMIAIKYGYMSEAELKKIRGKRTNAEISEFHTRNQIITSYHTINSETLYRELKRASESIGENIFDSFFVFSNDSQLEGFLKFTKIDLSDPHLGKLSGSSSDAIIKRRSKCGKYPEISVGVIASAILYSSERKTSALKKQFLYVNGVVYLMILITPLVARGVYAGNALAAASCIDIHEGEESLTVCASAWAGFDIIFNLLVISIQFLIFMLITTAAAVSFLRRHIILSECGNLIRIYRNENSKHPPTVKLDLYDNFFAWDLLRKSLVAFGSNYHQRLDVGCGMVILDGFILLALGIYALLSLSFTKTETFIVTATVLTSTIWVVVTFSKLLDAGEAANAEHDLHLNYLMHQRFDILRTARGQENEINYLISHNHVASIDCLEKSLENQYRLHPIKILGLTANRALFVRIFSLTLPLASYLARLFSIRLGYGGAYFAGR